MSSGQNSRRVIDAGTPVQVAALDRIAGTSGTSGQSARQALKAGPPMRTGAPDGIPQASGTSGLSVRQVINGGVPIRIALTQNAQASAFGQGATQVGNAGEPSRVSQPISKKE